MGFETSESFIAPRPVYTVALTEGECALATPPYANPDHTRIIHAPIETLLTVPEVKVEPAFWRSYGLREYRFDKNAANKMLFPLTMPRLTLGGEEGKLPVLTLDDISFIHFLAARGADEIPVAVRVLNGQPISYAQEMLGWPQAPLLDSILRHRTDRDVTGTGFTLFMPIEELENFINIRLMDFQGSLRAHWDGNDHSAYHALKTAAALLDELIAHGAPGAWVTNPNSVFSVTDAMHDVLGQGDMKPVRELPPMEWIDRFTRLYERQMYYRDHPSRDNGADRAPRERVDLLVAPIVHAIRESTEAMRLAATHLSEVAQKYFDEFPPPAVSCPAPTSVALAYEI